MKKIAFLGVISLLLFACNAKLTTDEIVAKINSSSDLKENVTETVCGAITYQLDGDEVCKYYVETYMGDGGSESTCYFADGKLIMCEYYTFYDGPMELEDGTYSAGGEAIGSNYKFYYEDGKLVKCIKDDADYTNQIGDMDPDPTYIYEEAMKIAKEVGKTESEILCY